MAYADKVEGIVGGVAIPVSGTVAISGTVPVSLAQIVAALALSDALANPTTSEIGANVLLWDGTQWVRARGNITDGLRVSPYRADQHITQGSAANTAQTVTLPAPGAGLAQYITHLRLTRAATAALVGTGGLATTSTNLNGRQWQYGNAAPVGGTLIDADEDFAHPIRAQVANTAVTIVTPAAGAAVASVINVDWYVAPFV